MSAETPGRADPSALTPAEAAALLTRVGGWRVTGAMLEADIAAGAPVSGDGTLHLTRYCAWLVREMGRGKSDGGGVGGEGDGA